MRCNFCCVSGCTHAFGKVGSHFVAFAGVVAFLCGPAGAYVSGQTLSVDGGYSVMGFY